MHIYIYDVSYFSNSLTLSLSIYTLRPSYTGCMTVGCWHRNGPPPPWGLGKGFLGSKYTTSYVIENASYSIYRLSISASLVSLYVYMNIVNCQLLAFVAMGSPYPSCGHTVASHALGASLLLAVFVRRVSGISMSHDCWFGVTAMGHRCRLATVCIHFLVFQCLCYMHTTKRFGKAGNSCITMTAERIFHLDLSRRLDQRTFNALLGKQGCTLHELQHAT